MAGTLALSGWGQPYDALAGIGPQATHVDYADYATAAEAVSTITEQMKTHDVVIGWSLGGQLAVRAIAAGARPKKLILIATPYQFVQRPELALGMARDTFAKFAGNYAKNPERTLHKARELTVMGDNRPAEIRRHTQAQDTAKVLAKDWGKWLHLLDEFSCETLEFEGFPPTLLVHGEGDVVVAAEQSFHFVKAMPEARLAVWPGCGHAPHWHDAVGLKQLIAEHLDV